MLTGRQQLLVSFHRMFEAARAQPGNGSRPGSGSADDSAPLPQQAAENCLHAVSHVQVGLDLPSGWSWFPQITHSVPGVHLSRVFCQRPCLPLLFTACVIFERSSEWDSQNAQQSLSNYLPRCCVNLSGLSKIHITSQACIDQYHGLQS